MNQLTINSTNPEIQNELAEQLATGSPVVFAVIPTKNPEYSTLCVAQEITTPSNASAEDALFLGWTENKSIVRYLRNTKNAQFDVLAQKWGKIGQGTVLAGTSIQVEESTTPRTYVNNAGETVSTSPKVYPASSKFAGKAIVDAETGKRIYRNTNLLLAPKAQHVFMVGVPEGSQAAIGAEVKSAFADLANA